MCQLAPGREGFWEEVGADGAVEVVRFHRGWWSAGASPGVGWSEVGFGDGDWPGRLERRVI